MFFTPNEPLDKDKNTKKFDETVKFIKSQYLNLGVKPTDKVVIKEREYPDGVYDVVNIDKEKKKIVVYLVSEEEGKFIVKFIQTDKEDTKEIIPEIAICVG